LNQVGTPVRARSAISARVEHDAHGSGGILTEDGPDAQCGGLERHHRMFREARFLRPFEGDGEPRAAGEVHAIVQFRFASPASEGRCQPLASVAPSEHLERVDGAAKIAAAIQHSAEQLARVIVLRVDGQRTLESRLGFVIAAPEKRSRSDTKIQTDVVGIGCEGVAEGDGSDVGLTGVESPPARLFL
jgi:hypothetical protein